MVVHGAERGHEAVTHRVKIKDDNMVEMPCSARVFLPLVEAPVAVVSPVMLSLGFVMQLLS